jgi:hypothetical protein
LALSFAPPFIRVYPDGAEPRVGGPENVNPFKATSPRYKLPQMAVFRHWTSKVTIVEVTDPVNWTSVVGSVYESAQQKLEPRRIAKPTTIKTALDLITNPPRRKLVSRRLNIKTLSNLTARAVVSRVNLFAVRGETFPSYDWFPDVTVCLQVI